MSYLKRQMESLVLQASRQFPVVTVVGPRQSGKTSMLRHLFTHKPYVNLENPDLLAAIQLDPRSFLRDHPDGAFIDEVQRFPALLSYIQTTVDANPTPGLFILTGSHQLMLHEAITQSLAGRTALLSLLPLSLSELENHPDSPDELMLQGFYPRQQVQGIQPQLFHQSYLQTYVERDVRLLVNIKDLTVFQNFIRLCASRVGQLFNLQSLATELGVAANTVKQWLSILEASFIVFKLPPYFENFGKRIIKTPKYYFIDVGLACYLLGITTVEQLKRDPLRGQLFENMVVIELLKQRFNQGLDGSLYFYRDSNHHEIDLLFRQGSELIPMEIKSGATFHPEFLKQLNYFQQLMPERVHQSYLVYTGDDQRTIKHTRILNYRSLPKMAR